MDKEVDKNYVSARQKTVKLSTNYSAGQYSITISFLVSANEDVLSVTRGDIKLFVRIENN